MDDLMNASSATLISADEGKVFTEPNLGFKKHKSKKKKEKDKKGRRASLNSTRDGNESVSEFEVLIQDVSTKGVKGEGPRSASLTLKDLKALFHASSPSYQSKKKVMRQPNNLYQPSPDFTNDFKPPKFSKSDDEKELIKKALRKNFVFSNLTRKELRPLIAAFEPCDFEAGETIIKQGDQGDYFYIIQKGRVVFQVNEDDVGKAGKGSSFGELALLYTCPRAATVVTVKRTKVFRVGQATFQFILQSQTAETAKEKFQLLKGVNFLKDLDMEHLKTLTNVMKPRIFKEGELLFRKGDPGDAFYVIQEGEVVIKDISVGSTTYEDLKLGPGGHFGERALITSEPRVANVVAKTAGVAFSIDRITFEKALGGMESLVIRAGDARLLSGITIFHRLKFSDDIFVQLADLVTDSSYAEQQTIMKLGQKVAAAIYIIREGQVEIRKSGKRSAEVLSTGQFFGHETMLTGATSGLPRVDAPYSATALTACVLGVLTLADCRYVFDMDLLTRKKRVPSFVRPKLELEEAPILPKAQIKFESLEKKTILGEGCFGQVWLVQGTDEVTGKKRPYALKIQSIRGLYDMGQIPAAIQEKQILSELNHPFIVELISTYKDRTFVYFLTEYVQGGELFTRIHTEKGSGMPEREAKFYALGVADALAYLHSLKVVYRDLKPENVLVDATGYPKIVDFGFAKYCPEKTFTFCGTPGYVSPEIVTKRGHNCISDYWSLGILIYEMISGENPFYFEGMDQLVLFRSIVEDDFLPLTGASEEAVEIINKLLVKDPSLRLGASKQCGFVVSHAWFADMDLDTVRSRKQQPPWKPACADEFDHANFDDCGYLEDKSKERHLSIPEKEKKLLEAF